MQFNSFIFILLFLPATVAFYFLGNKLNEIIGKCVLIVAGVIFYGYGDSRMLILMALSCAINFLFAKFIISKEGSKSKGLYLMLPIFVNVAMLFYFKYTNFAIDTVNRFFSSNFALREIVLPVGISFITFQQIAYLVAVNRKEIEEVKILDYLAFILYFPKLLMGPLMEPSDFLEQINDRTLKKIDWDNITLGLKIFSFGLFKKAFFANILAKAVSFGFSDIGAASAGDWIVIALCYTLEIYFDFSGYSDMAVGSSLMLNIMLPINFDSPYKALNMRDFWKRWHISLTKFLTKYIYIPLGGSRKGLAFTILNTMIVFLVSGIWHGANWTFILWGLLNGALCVFDRLTEKYQNRIFEPFRWLVTFIVINILWLLFNSSKIGEWRWILSIIFGMQNMAISDGLLSQFNLPEAQFLIDVFHLTGPVNNIRGFWMFFVLVPAFIISIVPENNYRNLKKCNLFWMILAALAFVAGFICLSSESVFIYFNF